MRRVAFALVAVVIGCASGARNARPRAAEGGETRTGTGSESGSGSASATASASASVPDPHLLDRIAVIGASVSAGFSSPRVAASLAASLPTSTITDAADLFTFRDPPAHGAAAIDAALAARPTLVIAIDFLFWYAYRDGSASDRAASLERGLAELERLDPATALAIGDLPDMRIADPRMLPPALVPPAAELPILNARIAAWAARRPRTVRLALAAWTAPLHGTADVELAPGETIAPTALLFLDRLHPNPLGLWYLLGRVDRALEESFAVPPAALVFARP